MRIRPLLDKAIVGQDIRQYSAVNIGYTDQDGERQETQLNVSQSLDAEDVRKSWKNCFHLFAKSLERQRTALTTWKLQPRMTRKNH